MLDARLSQSMDDDLFKWMKTVTDKDVIVLDPKINGNLFFAASTRMIGPIKEVAMDCNTGSLAIMNRLLGIVRFQRRLYG